MTKAQAIAAYASAYKAWLRGQMTAADLTAAKLAAVRRGASGSELAQAIGPANYKREPAP